MITRYTWASNKKNNLATVSRKVIDGWCDVHSHEFYELEYIISGSGSYTIDGTEYSIEPGMLFFMTPVNFHTVNAHNAEIYNVMFPDGVCDMYFSARLALSSNVVALKAEGRDKRYYEAILEELVENKSDPDLYSLLINCIMAKLSKSVVGENKNTLSVSQKAILYIITNFRTPITLGDVADHVGFAPSYLSDMFKKQTGVGIKQYLNSVRFEYAKNLIIHSKLSITQICSDSGFEDYSNFIRRFKERYGLSPSRYRKQFQ